MGLRYQYLRTIEALIDAVEKPRRGGAAQITSDLAENRADAAPRGRRW
jgi:hypothetical protein